MSSLKASGFPEDINGVPISPHYQNILNIHDILQEEGLGDYERFMLALDQLYPEIPSDLNQAFTDMLTFIRRGHEAAGSEDTARIMDYDQDADLIYSSFFTAYGLRLTDVEYMHYWEFLALLEGLPETTIFKKVIYWRTADLTKVSKEERKFILKMRKIYALDDSRFNDAEEDNLSIEELQQRAIDRANRRMAEVRDKVEKQKRKEE